jgi:ADP-ribosylglycohydrolase
MELDKFIAKNQEKTKKKVIQFLLDNNHKKDTIEETYKKYDDLVTNSINKDFLLPKVHQRYYRRMTEKILLTKIEVQIPELINWIWNCYNVVIYHILGDTIGYKNGEWEFNNNTANAGSEYVNQMINEFIYLGGVNRLDITNWRYSDDTVLYLKTFQSLDSVKNSDLIIRQLYVDSIPDLENRHPGVTTMRSLEVLNNQLDANIKYNSKSIGAGATMRTGCMGMFDFFPNMSCRETLLIIDAYEVSRLTHNSAIAIWGGITSALFTMYGLRKYPIESWPYKLILIIQFNQLEEHIKEHYPDDHELFMRDQIIFLGQWKKYMRIFFDGGKPKTDVKIFNYPAQRYKYLSENFSKGCDFPGACGDDCTIMAYDAVMRSGGNFEKLLIYACLHPGDSDTVGCVAFSWYGAYYGNTVGDEILKYIRSIEGICKIYELINGPVFVKRYIKSFYRDLYLSTFYNIYNN